MGDGKWQQEVKSVNMLSLKVLYVRIATCRIHTGVHPYCKKPQYTVPPIAPITGYPYMLMLKS